MALAAVGIGPSASAQSAALPAASAGVIDVAAPAPAAAATDVATPAAAAAAVSPTAASTPDAAPAAVASSTTTSPTSTSPAATTPPAAPQPATPPPAPDSAYGRREDVLVAAADIATRHGLELDWVVSQLAQARYRAAVARLIMPPATGTAKNWAAYRARFIEPSRIDAGVAFWRRHREALERAQAAHGVPAEIVVGIIGVETLYGRHMGNFRVLDALATLAFDFPPGRRDRREFFRAELGELLVLARREGRPATDFKGSYAGAIGLPQFMPSSWNRHAIDFDGDGHVDLRANPVDAIGSVAHYLARHGWTPGMPTWFEVEPPLDDAQRAVLLAPDIVPSFSAGEMTDRGATLAPQARDFGAKLALVRLENGEAAPSYVAGTPNFYAVTRYNWSSYYALAVIELGRAVAQAMDTR